MKRAFWALFVILLIGCHQVSSVPLKDTEDVQYCTKTWTDELGARTNCKIDNLAGFKSSTCYKNGKKDGLSCLYAENDMLMNEAHWKDDKKDGMDIDYFDNGNVKRIRTMRNHEMHGLAKGFYENGNLMFEGFYNSRCDLKYGTCYTKDGIAVPLTDSYLKSCYYHCEDVIKLELNKN